MARVQREYSPTGCYHIMMRGNERKSIFLDDNDRQRFLDTVLKKKHEFGLVVYGYCLMDNHIHLIMRNDRYNISTIMRGIATSYAMFFNIKYNRVGHVFQGRFKSEPVVDDRYLLSVLRYVHNNPVKAGIVEKPEHYAWSSYYSYISPEEIKLGDVRSVLEMFSSNLEKAIYAIVDGRGEYRNLI
ncbi:MAG: transposase [Syntrophomonas sp.]